MSFLHLVLVLWINSIFQPSFPIYPLTFGEGSLKQGLALTNLGTWGAFLGANTSQLGYLAVGSYLPEEILSMITMHKKVST